MVEGCVIWNKVQQQSHSVFVNSVAETLQGSVSAELGMRCVPGYGKAGSANIFFAEIAKNLAEFGLPFEVCTRDFSACRSRLPHAQKPDPMNASCCQPLQLLFGNIIESRLATKALGKISNPGSCVDLIQGRVSTFPGDAGFESMAPARFIP